MAISVDVSIIDNSQEFKAASDRMKQIALETIGLKAETYAKAICPVNTGRLRNRITHKTEHDAVTISANVEYAVYVELGTYKMRARPYIKPSIVNHTKEYSEIISSHAKNA